MTGLLAHEIKMHRRGCIKCSLSWHLLLSMGRGVREYYQLLPLCTAGSIQDAIDASSPGVSAFALGDCMEIFSEVAAGAQAIHDLGFSHRDIKPANIMFLPNGRPQLMDLGSCSLVNEHIESMKDAAMLADTASVKRHQLTAPRNCSTAPI